MGSRKCGGCLSGLLILLALWSITVNILLYFPNGQTSYASSNKLTNFVWYFEGICFSGVMMLIVAAVLLVLENDNNYKCCQSENCSKKYMTLLSIIFSVLGIAFSGYCLVISALGLVQGPYCRTLDGWEYAFEGTAGRRYSCGIEGPRKGGCKIESPSGCKKSFYMPSAPELFPTLKPKKPPFLMQEPQTATCFLITPFKLPLIFAVTCFQLLYPFQTVFLTDSSIWIQCLEPAHVVEWNIILFSILIVLSGLQVIVCLIRGIIQLSKILCGTYSVIIQPGII